MKPFNSTLQVKLNRIVRLHSATQRTSGLGPHRSLDEHVRRQSVLLGERLDELGELCAWIVDGETDYDEYGNETDSWRNVRPY